MVAVNYDWDEVEDNIDEEYDDGGVAVAEYTTEPDLYGNVISQFRNGQTSYLHSDALGSATELTDDAGTVTDKIRYSAFGEVTERTGSTEIPFQYVGQKGYQRDALTEEYYMRERSSDLPDGRWLSPDPRGPIDGPNLYYYVANNPIRFIDASGLARTIGPVTGDGGGFQPCVEIGRTESIVAKCGFTRSGERSAWTEYVDCPSRNPSKCCDDRAGHRYWGWMVVSTSLHKKIVIKERCVTPPSQVPLVGGVIISPPQSVNPAQACAVGAAALLAVGVTIISWRIVWRVEYETEPVKPRPRIRRPGILKRKVCHVWCPVVDQNGKVPAHCKDKWYEATATTCAEAKHAIAKKAGEDGCHKPGQWMIKHCQEEWIDG